MKLHDYLSALSDATSAAEIHELRATAESDPELSGRSVMRVQRTSCIRFEQLRIVSTAKRSTTTTPKKGARQ
jgi:hypothetical protein